MIRKKRNIDAIELLKKTIPSDFDGHTDFLSFSPGQKIRWLSSAAQFYFRSGAKGRQSAACNMMKKDENLDLLKRINTCFESDQSEKDRVTRENSYAKRKIVE